MDVSKHIRIALNTLSVLSIAHYIYEVHVLIFSSCFCTRDDYLAETQGTTQILHHHHLDADDHLLDDQYDHILPIATQQATIWGTDINVQNCINIFKLFLQNYHYLPGDTCSYYYRQLIHLHNTSQTILNLDMSHIRSFAASRVFYEHLATYPQEIIPILDRIATEEYHLANTHYNPSYASSSLAPITIHVRTYNVIQQSRLRDLDPMDIDRLVSLKGMVIRCSHVIPDLKVGLFRCSKCQYSVEVTIDRGRIEEPVTCAVCQGAHTMELLHNR
jgi:DNA replication licensing factor MCM4